MKKNGTGRVNQRWAKRQNYLGNKPYKSKVKLIEDDVFEVGSTQNAAQVTKSILSITDYIQVKYNNEFGEAVRTLTKPIFRKKII